MTGADPRVVTFRVLWWMFEGRERAAWKHTSILAAGIYNWIRSDKDRPQPFTPADFDPYAEHESRDRKSGIALTADTIGLLKVFLPRR